MEINDFTKAYLDKQLLLIIRLSKKRSQGSMPLIEDLARAAYEELSGKETLQQKNQELRGKEARRPL